MTGLGPVRVNDAVEIPADELSWRFSRSSGPGGQSVNTTDSRVALTWRISDSAAVSAAQKTRLFQRLGNRIVDGDLTVTASEERSQWQNRTTARRRLVQLVAAGLAPPPRPRKASRPTRSARERRLQGKRIRSGIKKHRRPPTRED